MRVIVVGMLCVSALLVSPVHASQEAKTTTFAVMRNDTQIGTNTINVTRDGTATTLQTVTHVEVKLGFLTLYHFDQTETERWADGQLLALNATTDDNGTLHKAVANSNDGNLVVEANGRATKLAATTIPLNPWNSALVGQNAALDPRDGQVVKINVTDRGEDNLVVRGHAIRAHHYVITANFPQDVWYDEDRRLVKLEMKGSDGSTILYQLV